MSIAQKAYQDIINQIDDYSKKYGKDVLWFRGENKLFPSMPSSMAREVSKLFGITDYQRSIRVNEQNLILDYERWILEGFKRYINIVHHDGYNHTPLYSWDILYFLQHYGIPTRFIDWSQSVDIALFFAYLRELENGDDARLWIIDPKLFNQLNRGEYEIKSPNNTYEEFVQLSRPFAISQKPVAISPNSDVGRVSIINQRIYSQYGFFVYAGLQYYDLRFLISMLAKSHNVEVNQVLYGITIPYEQIMLIGQYLNDVLGINKKALRLDEPNNLREKFSIENYCREKNK